LWNFYNEIWGNCVSKSRICDANRNYLTPETLAIAVAVVPIPIPIPVLGFEILMGTFEEYPNPGFVIVILDIVPAMETVAVNAAATGSVP
jgi:hypothetical protein